MNPPVIPRPLGHQKNIRPRPNRPVAHLLQRRPVRPRPVHEQIIGNRYPIEAQLTPQKIRKQIPRKRRRQPISRHRRKRQMTRHHRRQPRSDHRAVGHQIPFPESLQTREHHRQSPVRIIRRIPVPRKMLRRTDYPEFLLTLRESVSQNSRPVGIRRKSPGTDHIRPGIHEHIDRRGKIHIHPHRRQLPPDNAPGFKSIRRNRVRPQGHISRSNRTRTLHVAHPAPLLIRGDKQGNPESGRAGRPLIHPHRLGQTLQILRIPAEHLHPPQPRLANPAQSSRIRRIPGVTEHENLPQSLRIAHGVDNPHRQNPRGALIIEMGRA